MPSTPMAGADEGHTHDRGRQIVHAAVDDIALDDVAAGVALQQEIRAVVREGVVRYLILDRVGKVKCGDGIIVDRVRAEAVPTGDVVAG